ETAALEYPSHPELHGLYRADQLDLRLYYLLCHAGRIQGERTAVSYRLVRRVACNSDSRSLCHPHGRKSVSEPSQLAAVYHDNSGGDHRTAASVHTACSNTRFCPVAMAVLCFPRGSYRDVSLFCRDRETASLEENSRLELESPA